MRNLNKSNASASSQPINRTLKKKNNEKNNFKNMGTKCTQSHKGRKFSCSVIQGLTVQDSVKNVAKYGPKMYHLLILFQHYTN